jgi:hypothetical protein
MQLALFREGRERARLMRRTGCGQRLSLSWALPSPLPMRNGNPVWLTHDSPSYATILTEI